MKKKEHIKYWINSAEHDYDVAVTLFKSKKYDWCLFMGHLVLEKILKAFWIRDNKNIVPPRVHNLLNLAEQTKLKLTSNQKLFLLDVNDFNLEVRYPDYKFNFYKKCNKKFTEVNFKRIKAFYQWLKKQI